MRSRRWRGGWPPGWVAPEPSASIVSLRVQDAEAAEAALAAMGVRCAARGGNIRLSPHVYNTDDDIDRAIEVLARFI